MQDKTDKEILSELRAVTKNKAHWNTAIDDVAAKLGGRYSAIVKAKALWLLGEMGLYYPLQVRPYIEQIAGYLKDDNPKLRERSVNALGRIGRADKTLILPFFDGLINNPDASVGAQCSMFRTVCSIRWLQSALIPFVTTQASGY